MPLTKYCFYVCLGHISSEGLKDSDSEMDPDHSHVPATVMMACSYGDHMTQTIEWCRVPLGQPGLSPRPGSLDKQTMAFRIAAEDKLCGKRTGL